MSLGAVKKVIKVADGAQPILVPARTWTTLVRFTAAELAGDGLDLGWSLCDGEVYSQLPSLPKNVRSRWIRAHGPGTSDDDATKRTGLVVGTDTNWSALIPTAIEYLSLDDLPFEVQLWHDCGTSSQPQTISVYTAIATVFSPTAYAAARLTIGGP